MTVSRARRSWFPAEAAGRDPMLIAVVALAIGFGLMNGLHDAGNAIAAPVATRALRPSGAIAVSAAAHLAGALLGGTAVATTVAGVIDVGRVDLLLVLGAATLGALAWSVVTFAAGLPCSSGHTLVGALAGAALAGGGAGAVHWGGLDGLRPVGVVGSLIWLLFSSAVAAPLALWAMATARRLVRRAAAGLATPIRRGETVTTAALSFAHGANDAQKTMGLLALAVLAPRSRLPIVVPEWAVLAAAGALTAGTSLGGWRVVRTLGRGIYPLRSLEGLVSQASAAAIVLGASFAGAPISTTDVVAPAVVGVGASARRHHVHWHVVRDIALAWLVSLPAAGLLSAGALFAWSALR